MASWQTTVEKLLAQISDLSVELHKVERDLQVEESRGLEEKKTILQYLERVCDAPDEWRKTEIRSYKDLILRIEENIVKHNQRIVDLHAMIDDTTSAIHVILSNEIRKVSL